MEKLSGYQRLDVIGNYAKLYTYEIKKAPVVKRTKKKTVRGSRRNTFFTVRNSRERKKNFQDLVLANIGTDQIPYFVTFTFYQVLPLRECWYTYKQFIQYIRRYVGKDFRYIAVPEFQKRGAVHFHVLFWGLDHIFQNERELRFIQRLWLQGFVDVIKTDGSSKLSGYFAKYMSKALHDERLYCERAYSSSRNVMRKVSLTTDTQVAYASDALELSSDCLVDLPYEYETRWFGKCRVFTYLYK